MISLAQAIGAMSDRLMVIEPPEFEDQSGFEGDDGTLRLMLVGTGIDMTELEEATEEITTKALLGVSSGETTVVSAMAGTWIQGLITGVILEQMRQQERTKENR